MKLNAPWLDWPEIKQLAAAFTSENAELRFVGGAVRDTIMGREVIELDAATTALPRQTIAILEKAGLRAIPTGLDHGTVTALVGDRSIEITTLRKDISTDGRHAEVAYTTKWQEDAKRRDFTMNALYLGLDGELYDDVNGVADCETKTVRFIGDARTRIREDYLRILRYFRFVATVANNRFDNDALAACAAEKQGIAGLSGERITVELLKLLAANQSHLVIAAMKETGILSLVLSGAKNDLAPIEKLDQLGASAHLKLAALIGETSALSALADRLKFSSKQKKSIERWLTYCSKMIPDMDELSQKKCVRALGVADYQSAIQLAHAFSNEPWERYAPLLAMSAWEPPALPVAARDLMDKGYTEGKALGDALKALEHAWEESGYSLGRDKLLTMLR